MSSELCDDFLLMLIEKVVEIEGLCAAKQLRSMARMSKLFAYAARSHLDNIRTTRFLRQYICLCTYIE